MITVNTNMPSMITQRSLLKATNNMNNALQRLSTGYRINSSKDDAAGLAISTNLDYKTSSYKVAKNNTQMGQSMLETASGSLSNIKNMLQRMRDLAEQSANGTYGEDERKAMQTEVDALTDEIFRIKNTTEFNGRKILGEEEKPVLSSVPTISMSEINSIKDLSNLDKGEIIGISSAEEFRNLSKLLNADESLSTGRTFVLTDDIDLNNLEFDPIHKFTGTFDGNNYFISNLKIDSTIHYLGLFCNVDYATIKNLNLENVDIKGSQYYQTIGAMVGASSNSHIINCSVSGTIDCRNSDKAGGLIGIMYPSTIINCKSTVKILGDATKNGAFIGQSSALNAKSLGNEYNPNVNEQLNPIGSGSTSFSDEQLKANENLVVDSQSNVSKITSLQVGINNNKNSVIDVDTGFSIGNFNVSLKNDDTSRKYLDKIDAMIAKVTNKMTEIGAVQNRLESSMEFQDTHITALTASNSLIKDADIAEESSNYIRSQILQQTTSTLLATANQAPSIALQLI